MPTRLRMAIDVDLGQRLAAVVRDLRGAGRGDLQRDMVRTIRALGAPALAAVRGSLRAADLPARPSRGGVGSTGLRARMARAAAIVTTAGGVRIEIRGQKVDPRYGTSLVLAANGLARLRHPVYGNRRVWVTQRGTAERFYSALRPYERRWREGVEQVMEDFARRVGS